MKNTNKEEIIAIGKILERADKLGIISKDRITLMLDLEHAHKDIKIDFEGLLQADDFNFMHDICGIQANFNRATKKMDNNFLPRFAINY